MNDDDEDCVEFDPHPSRPDSFWIVKDFPERTPLLPSFAWMDRLKYFFGEKIRDSNDDQLSPNADNPTLLPKTRFKNDLNDDRFSLNRDPNKKSQPSSSSKMTAATAVAAPDSSSETQAIQPKQNIVRKTCRCCARSLTVLKPKRFKPIKSMLRSIKLHNISDRSRNIVLSKFQLGFYEKWSMKTERSKNK